MEEKGVDRGGAPGNSRTENRVEFWMVVKMEVVVDTNG